MGNIQLQDHTIQCDNPKCDYQTIAQIAEFGKWVNKPCPICGENLLTQGDYDRFMIVVKALDIANGLVENMNPDDLGDPVKMTVNTHKSLTITIEDVPPKDVE